MTPNFTRNLSKTYFPLGWFSIGGAVTYKYFGRLFYNEHYFVNQDEVSED